MVLQKEKMHPSYKICVPKIELVFLSVKLKYQKKNIM